MENQLINGYCKICGSCGEEFCCSPLMCDFSEKCEYSEKYLKDLKFAYLMFNDFSDIIPNDSETKNKYDIIYQKNFDRIYGIQSSSKK